MIEIIEHKDYNKPVDNDTIIEADGPKGIKTKLFKVFDGIWLEPHPLDTKDFPKDTTAIIPPYNANYCKTIEQKSKYLEQMTILFKRINSVPLGQALLTELHKGSPIDFSSTEVWNSSNMVTPRTSDDIANRKLRASCLIRPNSSYIENYASVNGTFKVNDINVSKAFIYFHPDCIYSIKKDNKVNYFDPAVALYHELLHVCHSLYGIVGSSYREEEYITFGHLEAAYFLEKKSTHYKLRLNILSKNLGIIKQQILNIKDPIDKKYFEDKYGFARNVTINEQFVDNYISKYQIVQSEHNFAKSLNLKGKNVRTSYEDEFFLAFNFDISDPKIYKIKTGFLNLGNKIEDIVANPSHIFGTFHVDQITETLNKCGIGKSKRDSDLYFIPLEPLREDIDGRHAHEKNHIKTRAKRETSQCKESIADLLEDIDTVYNKSKEIPERILRGYTAEQIENVSQDQVFNKPPKNIDLESIYQRLETFKVGDLVGFDRITPKDIFNAHRFNHELVDVYDTPLNFTSNNINYAKNFSNISYTPNKKITNQMNLMDKGKAVLRAGNTIVNIAQFSMWVDELIEDFKGETGKDDLHIVNDILAITPYLGQVMNIGIDIKDSNYLGALKGLGILVFLEVFPELLLPVFLIDVILSSIKQNSHQKEIVSKAVWNILMERKQLLDSQLETEAENLAHICIERIQKIADHVQRQLLFTTNSIIHNIHHYGYKQFKNNEDISFLNNIAYESRQKMLLIVEEKRNKVIETLFAQLKKTISVDFKTLAKSQISQFNEQTKSIIQDMLKQHSKDISSQVVDEALKIVDHHIKTQDVIKNIQHELNTLSNMLDIGTEIIFHQKGTPLIYSHIGLNKDNKAIDKLTNMVIGSQNISYSWGRNGNALKIASGNYLNIEAHFFSHINLFTDFTVEFWIKVPLTKDYNGDTSHDVPIIKSSFDNRTRRAFVLNGIFLQYVEYLKGGKKLVIGNYMIANNKWVKVTVVNNAETQLIGFFINGKIINSMSTSWILLRDLDFKCNNIITLVLPKTNNLCFMVDDLKIYTLALTNYQIQISYEKDINPELLYDYFGNCLKENREYIMAVYNIENNEYYPITQKGTTNFMVYQDNNKIKLKNYDFTISINSKNTGSDTKRKDPLSAFIYKNDNVLLTSYNQHSIWSIPKDDEKWGTEEIHQEEHFLSINNETRRFVGEKVQRLDSDFATKYDSYCIFKIFNIYDYFNKSDLLNNNNGVSFALYKENILKSLNLAHKGNVLTIDGILENKSSSDTNIKLPTAYSNVINDLEDYTYKAAFYLFPVDEIEYYSNMYE